MIQRVTEASSLARLGGFPSQGMVLCASSADHTVVKCVEPPDTAKPGTRVDLPGLANPPASEKQTDKSVPFLSARTS